MSWFGRSTIERIDAWWRNSTPLSGNSLIEKKDAARLVIKALRANAAVGILIDQNTSPTEGVWIDFFGKLACASSAFVKLAHHSGARGRARVSRYGTKAGAICSAFLSSSGNDGRVQPTRRRSTASSSKSFVNIPNSGCGSIAAGRLAPR